MRTSIYIRRDGKHVATEYANNAEEAYAVLDKYIKRFIDDEFECEPLLRDGEALRPFWTIRFTSHFPFILCDDVRF